MLRWLLVFAGASLVWLADAPLLLAADGAGDWPSTGVPFSRGDGGYLSITKLLLSWFLFVMWVRSTDWVSQDAQQLKLPYNRWNAIVFFSFFVTLLLFWIIPWFFLGIALLALAYIVPLVMYIVTRNKLVLSPGDKVGSTKHFKKWLARKASGIGIKTAEDDSDEAGPDVQFNAAGGANEEENRANLFAARRAAGFLPAREILDDAVKQRATHVMLDYTAETVGVRYQIDGVWHDAASIERERGDAALEVFKGLAALNVQDRRSRQSGSFAVEAGKEKLNCKITSQGTPEGERVLLQIQQKKVFFKNTDEIGMRAKMHEQIDELFQQNGMLIFCSVPGGGLTTTLDVVLSSTDRYVRNFVSVDDSDRPERDIENIHITTYSSAAGESPASVLPKLVRTYPDVIVVRDLVDLESLTQLCEQVGENRLVVTGTRAKEAVEAPLRLMMMKIPPADLAGVLTGVLNVRLVRKLCEKCKESYPPPPEVLKQLGLPAGRVEALFRPPTEPIDPKRPDVVCDQCRGIGYFGRTGIFELLILDDDLRQVYATTPKLDVVRAAARKARHRGLQEEGVLLVARGVTSIQELVRALKQ